MKRFLCAFASCLVVAVAPAAADDVIELDGVIGPNGIQLKIVPANEKDKIDQDKLVGTWEAKKLAPGLELLPFPQGTRTWEFKKDGTVEVFIEAQVPGQDQVFNLQIAAGKYEVNGNKLTITLEKRIEQDNEKEEKEVTYKTTITKLTDKEFQTKDEKGKVCEFTKK